MAQRFDGTVGGLSEADEVASCYAGPAWAAAPDRPAPMGNRRIVEGAAGGQAGERWVRAPPFSWV